MDANLILEAYRAQRNAAMDALAIAQARIKELETPGGAEPGPGPGQPGPVEPGPQTPGGAEPGPGPGE